MDRRANVQTRQTRQGAGTGISSSTQNRNLVYATPVAYKSSPPKGAI